MNFSNQLKKYRKLNKLSQEETAKKLYISRQTISKWENNKSYPDIHNLIALSILFNISVDELIKGDIQIMKKKGTNKTLTFWSMIMLISGILLPLSMGATLKFLGITKFIIISIILILILAISAIKIELIKKRNNLKTYSEILYFIDNIPIDSKTNKKEYKNLNRISFIYALLAAIVTTILILISFFIFNISLK